MGEDVDAAPGDPGVGDSSGRRDADRAGATSDRENHKNRRRHSHPQSEAGAHDDNDEEEEEDDDDDDDDDNTDDGNDSVAGSDYSSVSVDELPPIRAYGHTYHGSGVLLMPNDESERARLEIQHQLFKLCLEGGLTATKLPRDQPLNILDVGAGTGSWAVEMARQHPRAKIMGVDMSAALLPTSVPPNVVFEVEDATEPWHREKDSLDFVHMRNLVGGGVPDWRSLFRQAYLHLKPGGAVEFSEARTRYFDLVDGGVDEPKGKSSSSSSPASSSSSSLSMTAAAEGEEEDEEERGGRMTASREFEVRLTQMAERAGVDFDPIPKIPAILAEVGFEKVGRWSDLVPVQAVGHDEKMIRKGAQFAQMIEYGAFPSLSLPPFHTLSVSSRGAIRMFCSHI